ncbi:hypothetical protein [Paraburkholderia acidipaludis]|uniref:hypothetical protein n=1 Tax=Paraburkholderia acidipaludis TaxID=660537 RepID=UPI000482BD62|nr:hypothetical protein [Paraburkholderia acidipaludis]
MENINATETNTQELDTSAAKEFPIEKSKLKKALEKNKQSVGFEFSSNKLESHDENVVIPLLKAELDDLKKRGESIRKKIDGFHGKIQQSAIDELAKCLGIRQKFFKIDSILLQDKIYATLYEKAMNEPFKKKRKNTTEYHLISRIYRGEERRQASSDALILQRANDAGQTEQTFAAWVLAEKGLDEIRRAISAERKVANSSNGKLKKKISKNVGTDRFIKLFNDLNHSGHVRDMTVLEKDEMHTLFGSWLIWEPENSVPIVVYPRKDGKFQIRKLDLNAMRTNNPS